MKTLNVDDLNLDTNYDRAQTTAGVLANNSKYFEGYTAHFINNNNVIIVDGDGFGQNGFGIFALIDNARFGISSDTIVELRRGLK